jgi:hypothetical protein
VIEEFFFHRLFAEYVVIFLGDAERPLALSDRDSLER